MPTAVNSTSLHTDITTMRPGDDEPSVHGRFCWENVGNTSLPCLLKKDGTKYVSVRIAEMKVLKNYLKYFNFEMFACVSVASYRISEAETSLLNYVNKEQCDNSYGPQKFARERDFIVKLDDLHEYYQFLETCYNKLLRVATTDIKESRCGFIQINHESVVPYTMNSGTKYLPLFYFEGDTDHLKVNSTRISGWDLAYLKFCCKVQGIRNELFASDHCLMISLQDVKSYFPDDSVFEDYWPPQIIQNAMRMNGTTATNGVHSWVQSPMGLPSTTSPTVTSHYSRPSNRVTTTTAWPSNSPSIASRQVNGYYSPSQTGTNRIVYSGSLKTRPQAVNSVMPPNNSTRPGTSQFMLNNNGQALPAAMLNFRGAQNQATPATPRLPTNVPKQIAQMCNGPNPNGLNGPSNKRRLDVTNSDEIIDLSSPPPSPVATEVVTVTVPHDDKSSCLPPLVRIENVLKTLQYDKPPYMTKLRIFQNARLFCINLTPFEYLENNLITPISDLLCLFPPTTIHDLRFKMQNVLRITLYQPNRAQMSLLKEHHKCQSSDEEVPMVAVPDFEKHVKQLRYMHNPIPRPNQVPNSNKRQRVP